VVWWARRSDAARPFHCGLLILLLLLLIALHCKWWGRVITSHIVRLACVRADFWGVDFALYIVPKFIISQIKP